MPDLRALAATLRGLEGRGYKAYKTIAGEYDAGTFRLLIDHVQGDPFAEASRLRAIVPAATSQVPEWAVRSDARRTAAADFLNRTLLAALHAAALRRGSGNSGELTMLRPGQAVLGRSSVTVAPDGSVEARFRAGLPARGRTIMGRDAAELITRQVVAAVHDGLCLPALDTAALATHVETVEDARALREQLRGHGWSPSSPTAPACHAGRASMTGRSRATASCRFALRRP
jgi:predicted ABC-class ATPase